MEEKSRGALSVRTDHFTKLHQEVRSIGGKKSFYSVVK